MTVDIPTMRISVIVPSYMRPSSLSACLRALRDQRLAATEVIVVARQGDVDTAALCSDATVALPNLRLVLVDRPGTVAALNAGCRVARGEIIAVTDDDAQPEEEWIYRIATEFAEDPQLGALGGPDLLEGREHERVGAGCVGRASWYGRMVGNHHAGTVREEVDYLKGVNMAFRTSVLPEFDHLLRGAGAQVGLDMKPPLAIKRRGYKVLYEPSLRVRHYPATRAAGAPRQNRSLRALWDQHHNETYIVASTMPAWRAATCTAYSVLIGYQSAVGIAHLGLRLVRGPQRLRAVAEFIAVLGGRVEGLCTALRGHQTATIR